MRLSRGLSLAVKLALALLLACFAVYALVLLDVHGWTRAMLLEHIQREGEAVIAGAAARIDAELQRVEEASRRLAHALGQQRPERAELERNLCTTVAASPTVFGCAAAFEPGGFTPGLEAFSPYCFRDGAALRVKDLALDGYDYPRRDWYRLRGTAASRSGRSRISTRAAARAREQPSLYSSDVLP